MMWKIKIKEMTWPKMRGIKELGALDAGKTLSRAEVKLGRSHTSACVQDLKKVSSP